LAAAAAGKSKTSSVGHIFENPFQNLFSVHQREYSIDERNLKIW
jgi:hypothetical protein